MEALWSSETSVGANQCGVTSQNNWTEFPSQREVSKFVLVLNYALIYADVWWNRTAAWMLFLCPRWRRKICFSARRLYAREKNPSVYLTGELPGPTKGLLAWWKKISSFLIQLTHRQMHTNSFDGLKLTLKHLKQRSTCFGHTIILRSIHCFLLKLQFKNTQWFTSLLYWLNQLSNTTNLWQIYVYYIGIDYMFRRLWPSSGWWIDKNT